LIKKELRAVRINSVPQEIEHIQSDALSVLEQPYEGMPEQPPEVIPEQSQKNTRQVVMKWEVCKEVMCS